MKKQPSEWGKIMSANHIYGKRLIYKICNELTQLNSIDKKLKVGGESHQIFSKEDTQKVNIHDKLLKSLIIMEMQSKPTMKYYLTPVKMAILKKHHQQAKSVGQVTGRRETQYTVNGTVNWFNRPGKQQGVISKSLNDYNHMTQQFHFWVFIQST